MSPSDKEQPKTGYIVYAQALAFQQGTAASSSRLSLTGKVRNCGFLSAPGVKKGSLAPSKCPRWLPISGGA